MRHNKDITGKVWCVQLLLAWTTLLGTLVIHHCKIGYHLVLGGTLLVYPK